MINQLKFYAKMTHKILSKDVIGNNDYGKEYDKIADTYQYWLKEMSRFTDRIIKPAYAANTERPKVLDFACGTGYITRRLLEKETDCDITAVDISERMLHVCKDLADHGVNIVNADGIAFLNNTAERFDIIFCGWALPYFNYKVLLKGFKKVLNEGGIVGVISNSRGTLHKIEDIFVKVMMENQNEIVKPMDIRFNLPDGKEGLAKWFEQYGFACLEVHEEEVVFSFDRPEDLFDWINKTGAAAGTAQIFRDYDRVKGKIIKEIEREKCIKGRYSINHKFTYGLFKRS